MGHCDMVYGEGGCLTPPLGCLAKSATQQLKKICHTKKGLNLPPVPRWPYVWSSAPRVPDPIKSYKFRGLSSPGGYRHRGVQPTTAARIYISRQAVSEASPVGLGDTHHWHTWCRRGSPVTEVGGHSSCRPNMSAPRHRGPFPSFFLFAWDGISLPIAVGRSRTTGGGVGLVESLHGGGVRCRAWRFSPTHTTTPYIPTCLFPPAVIRLPGRDESRRWDGFPRWGVVRIFTAGSGAYVAELLGGFSAWICSVAHTRREGT